MESQDFPGGACGYDSGLPLQGAQIWSLAEELRSCMPHGVAKNK